MNEDPCESSPSSLEPVADCSGQCCSDGGQLPLLSTTPTASACSVRGAVLWPTPQCMDAITMTRPVTWRANSPRIVSNQGVDGMAGLRDVVASVSMATSAPSTPPSTGAAWTSSPAASPASLTHRPANASAAWTPETSDLTPFAYCEKVVLPSGSSRTYPVSSQAEMTPDSPTSGASSVTYPLQGSMRNGSCWERTTSVPRIGANDCGYSRSYQTPSVEDASRQGSAEGWRQWEDESRTTQCRLRNQVQARGGSTPQTWPTPDAAVMNLTADPEKHQARLDELKKKHANGNGAGTPLAVRVRQWPTPDQFSNSPSMNQSKPRMGTIRGHMERSGMQLGSLNPTWVEWLMGWPRGWTDCEHLVTDRCLRRWLQLSRSWLGVPDWGAER